MEKTYEENTKTRRGRGRHVKNNKKMTNIKNNDIEKKKEE